MSKNETKWVYVAFDCMGRHYRYAIHPDRLSEIPGIDNLQSEIEEQKREIARMRSEARRRGGRVELLSADDFQRRVLDNQMQASA